MSNTVTTRLFAFLSAILYFILGFLMLSNPGSTLVSVILVMGVFLILIGIFLIIDGFRLPSYVSYKVPYILDGVLSLLLGLAFVFGNAFINITVLAYMLVIWFIVSAIIQIYLAWSAGGWVSVVSIILNVLVIILAILALTDPALAQGVLIWYLAFQFILMGINRLFIAFDPGATRER